jgi:hypothetical protein
MEPTIDAPPCVNRGNLSANITASGSAVPMTGEIADLLLDLIPLLHVH